MGLPVLARMETRADLAKEAALFGEVTYDITPKLSLTAGARVFHVSRDVSAHTSGLLVETPIPLPAPTSNRVSLRNGFSRTNLFPT